MRKALAVLGLVAMLAAGCAPATATPTPAATSGPTPAPTAAPTVPPGTAIPSLVSPRIIVTGQVQDVAASARVISLTGPAAGFVAIALDPGAELVSDLGAAITLTSIRPGDAIQAAGDVFTEGTLVATRVLLITADTVPITVISWLPVAIDEAGILVDVPADWQQIQPDWTWSPPGEGTLRLSVRWQDAGAGWTPEDMLPPGEILSSESASLTWATEAMRFEIRVSVGSDIAYQEHVVALGDNQRAYDISTYAQSREQGAALAAVLTHAAQSVAFNP